MNPTCILWIRFGFVAVVANMSRIQPDLVILVTSCERELSNRKSQNSSGTIFELLTFASHVFQSVWKIEIPTDDYVGMLPKVSVNSRQ